MALKINYNFQSDFTHANMLKTEYNVNKNLERLATGYRINRAADDAAGLYIADQLKTYAISVDRGTQNAQDGVSIAQIAQGSLSEVYNILNDIKSKTIQASNTLNEDARKSLQQDINKLTDAIGKIFNDTEFNGTNLFGQASITFNTSGEVTTVKALTSASISAKGFKIHYGGRKDQELTIGAEVADVKAGSTGTVASYVVLNDGSTASVSNVYKIDVTSQSAANESVATVDELIKKVDTAAAKYGSAQIELEKIISNNETQAVNTRDAEGRIRNVDFAKEMADYTKNNILMQSGTAMLAQANQQSQLVLQLLR